MKTNVFEFCHNGKFWDDNPRHDYDGLIRALKKEFRVLGEGTHRVGFEHGDYVIKAPKSGKLKAYDFGLH